MKFRLPRKTKKKLLKAHLFYPRDKDGSHLVAQPARNQKEYDLYKGGFLIDPFIITKKQLKEYSEKLYTPIEMSKSELKKGVDFIFAKEYRTPALITLLKAKEHKIAKKYYYGFINGYNLTMNGERYGNTCCLCVDSAKELMK